ncbi:MAG: NUDIX hydrolase [Spirochaetota bacterium]
MEKLEDSKKFKDWQNVLLKNGIEINRITNLKTIHKGNGEALFGLVDLDAKDSQGQKLLPAVLLRGHYVCVLVCLIDKSSKKRQYLLVKQRRVADGSIFYEHPAGMCDNEEDPWAVAIKEVQEETGLNINKENLSLLVEKPLFSSPGLLDESGYFFCCEIELSQQEILSFANKATGAEGENEFIVTHLCEEKDLMQLVKNTSSYLLNLLYLQKIRAQT